MDAVGALIIRLNRGELKQKSSTALLDFRSDENQVSIGRGFNNDLIVNDPFVDAQQLLLTAEGESWQMRILQNTNGVRLNDKLLSKSDTNVAVQAGDIITIGRTRLEVFTEDSQIEATRKLHFNIPLASGVWSVALALFIFSLSLLVDLFQEYMGSHSEYNISVWGIVLATSAVMALLWAGFWSTISKFVRHKFNFFAHIKSYSIISILAFFAFSFTTYLEFALDENTLSDLLSWLVVGLVLSLLIREALRISTDISRPVYAALISSAIIIGSVLLVTELIKEEFPYGEGVHMGSIQPGSLHIKPTGSIDNFFENANHSFSELDELLTNAVQDKNKN